MAQVSLDMYQTLAIAVVALLIGAWLKTKIKVLDRLCIPSPVVGGLLFSIITCVLYAASIVDFRWDDTLKNVCMVIFFTSVGFQANVKVLKSGGKALIVLLFCVLFLIEAQDVIAVAASTRSSALQLALSPWLVATARQARSAPCSKTWA